ncbi:SUMF1/EgtB/PvdO family nonheme iron enzyme [Azospirillum brasilense]|nr:SUMF1/EgtB/PvdO family nonheme iron enzyme [Azospirillum brasilense]
MFDGPLTQRCSGGDIWSLAVILLLVGLLGWAPGVAAQSASPQSPPTQASQSPPTQASQSPEKRIALVVGIGKYEFAPELQNPVNDAKAIAEALRMLQFDVDEKFDMDNRGFERALRDFGIRASQADVAVIFYAGHGIQVGGNNYIVPADAKLERERDLVYEAMPLNLMMGELSQARKLGILMLDSCRNNPFVDRLKQAGQNRIQVNYGFARVDDTPSDTLVAMATRADQLAEDGQGDHSPYTDALLQHLQTPGLELSLFFRNVRDTVRQATNGRQEPYIFGSLGAAPFYFNPRPPNRPPVLGEIRPLELSDRGDAEPLRIGRPTDPDDDQLFAQISGLPRGGSVRIGDRIVLIGDYLTVEQLAATSFKPDATVVGDAGRFDFAIMDGRGGVVRGGVAITIKPSNREPVVAGARTIRALPNPLAIEAPVDPDGDPLTVTITAVPDRGKVRDGATLIRPGDRLPAEGLTRLTFDPEQERAGAAGAFTYQVEDGKGGKATGTVTLEIAPPGAAPAAPALEESLWQMVKGSREPADFEAFLRLFGSGAYAKPAREKLGALTPAAKPPEVASARPPPSTQSAPPPVPPPAPVVEAAASPPPASPQPVPAPEQVAAAPPNGNGNSAVRNHSRSASFQDCPACPVMVRIAPGSFTMGSDQGDRSERPVHKVTIAKPFALGAYEVTVAEWRACVEGGGCTGGMPRMTKPTDSTPIHNISWLEAQAYAKWLSQKTGQRYRLPSEAEWEYAARGGTTGRYWWDGQTGTLANCKDCGGAQERLTPASVGSYKPNPFGLHDMNGGVAEWVADCWHADYAGAPTDGSAWTSTNCRERVLRGGSWRGGLADITDTARLFYDPDVRYLNNGVRVLRELN